MASLIFRLLHADLAAGRMDRLLYYAFDLLYLDGFDLRGARLVERKRVLAALLAGAPVPALPAPARTVAQVSST
jgi:ATP-dependent DNA ligase